MISHLLFFLLSNASASYVIPKKNKKRLSRSKRGVPQLYSMVKCATGCDPIVYKGYGCYCGFLGQGEPLVSVLFIAAEKTTRHRSQLSGGTEQHSTAYFSLFPYLQDGIDKCCKLHDTCYSHTRCTPYLEYFVPYLWKCYKGTPLCGKLSNVTHVQ